MRSTLIIMAKAPISGMSKTRLIPSLGVDGARELAEKLFHHAINQAIGSAPHFLDICCAPDVSHPSFQRYAQFEGVELSAQVEGGLGKRMQAAFQHHLPNEAGVLMMGTDAPGLTAQVIKHASEELQHYDAVFVPTLDGGYALIGLKREQAQLFADDIAWSTSGVMEQTRERLAELCLTWLELPCVIDIDEATDLHCLPASWSFEES